MKKTSTTEDNPQRPKESEKKSVGEWKAEMTQALNGATNEIGDRVGNAADDLHESIRKIVDRSIESRDLQK